MKKGNFLKVLFCVMFFVIISAKGFCQEMTSNYYIQVKATTAIPLHIDEGILTEQDKDELTKEEREFDDCGEEEDGYFSMGLYFDMDIVDIIFELIEDWQKVSVKDNNVITAVIEDTIEESFVERIELIINLNDLTIEQRLSYPEKNNLFFGEEGNTLWSIQRIDFKRVGEYVIPIKVTDIWYDVLESEIPYEVTNVTSFLYYEVKENDVTLVKDGDEDIFNDCMGYTGVKEIQITELKIYPNPTNEQITINLPSKLDANTDVKIYNILGVNVLSQQHNGSQHLSIDVHSLLSGVYVVRGIKNNKVISTRFIKQ